jgi:hypothetical protein
MISDAETSFTSGNQLQERIRKWLSPPDPSINHNITCEIHHSGTATWFIQGTVYDEWKMSGSLLWLHGKRTSLLTFLVFVTDRDSGLIAGSGKSVLW